MRYREQATSEQAIMERSSKLSVIGILKLNVSYRFINYQLQLENV
ncbi:MULTISPECIES: hypothetical protein [Clostridia]|nr:MULTISPECIES: hypothetical protein [Clostridia]